jgi:hypothetical protein
MSESAETIWAGGAATTLAEAAELARRRSDGQRRVIMTTIALVIVLALATILAFRHLPRYQLPGRSILINGDFQAGFAGWQIDGLISLDETEVGMAVLQNRDAGHSVYLRRVLRLPPGRTSLRLAADVATDRVDGGEGPWQRARVYLVERTSDGRDLWDRPHQLVGLVGSTSRRRYEHIFEIPSAIPEVVLGIELPHATGSLEVAALELTVLEEQPVFRLVAALLVCGWSLLFFWVISGIYDTIKSSMVRRALLVTLGLVFVGVFTPATLRHQVVGGVAARLGLGLADPAALGHTVIFGLLAFLVRLGRPRDSILLHLSCWLLLAAVVEILELLSANGTPSAGDWLTYALGTVLGLGLGEIAQHVQRWLELRQRPG